MRKRLLIAGLLSASAAATTAEIVTKPQDVNGFLPEHVLIRTQTQTFCKFGEFVLVDGRIYAKLPGEESWTLFLKTGLPQAKKLKKLHRFETPERIVELAADEFSLYCFDNEGYMYTCFLNKKNVRLKPFRWNKLFGFPKSPDTMLQQNDLVNDKIAFSLGSRRSEVLYHSDIYGNEHHYGTMGLDTVYFLNHEGTQIRFTDSGLPPDFSRQIQMPEKGRFIAQNMSVSGETIFLIGSKGSMYTRMIDFDTMGCDMMFFDYTYDKVETKHKGTEYLSNYDQWALPAEPWMEHEKIPLKGKARLTKYCHINSNGQGNFTRTMRVIGTNEDGTLGYYEKQLLDKEWSFTPYPFEITDEDWLDDSKPELQADEMEHTYTGYISCNDEKVEGITVSVKGVSLCSEDDLVMNINYKAADGTEEVFESTLYAVEKWTYIRRYDSGFDGTVRSYFVTPEFDENKLNSTEYSEDFKMILTDIFAGRHHKVFCFSAEGTTDFFQMEIDGQRERKSDDPFALKTNRYTVFLNSKINADITPSVYKAATFINQPLLQKITDTKLELEPGKTYTPKDRSVIQATIDSNVRYRSDIKNDLKSDRKIGAKSELSRFGYDTVDLITKITLLNNLKFPKIKQVTSYGGEIMASNSMVFNELATYKEFIYPKLIELVDLRIDLYQGLISDFDNNKLASTLSPYAKTNFSELYDMVGLPSIVKAIYNDNALILQRMIDFPYFPGYLLQSDDGTFLLIFMEDSVEKCYKTLKSGKTPAEKPLNFKVSFVVANLPPNPETSKFVNELTKKKGNLIWDGENLVIKAKGGKILEAKTK